MTSKTGTDTVTAVWDRRSLVEQARVEELALADWLPGAATFAPHWSGIVNDLGLAPGDLVTRRELLRIPPSIQGQVATRGGTRLVQRPTENQVKAVASASLLLRIARGIGGDQRAGKRDLLLREFKSIHVTRGGAADQLAVASSRADLDRQHRVGARAASLLGLGDHDYLVSAVPAGPSAEFWSVHALAMGSSMLALHPRGHGQGLAGCLEAFALMPTTAVACLPDDAVAWAEALHEADQDVSRVVVVLLVGPPVGDETRATIKAAWRTAGALESELVVRSVWAPNVHRGIWTECLEGATGLHTMPDLEILEVLDGATGQPTDGSGDLTVTSLGWTGTTLLRFRTGVEVGGLTTEACPACNRTVPRVVGPITPGRWQPELDRAGTKTTLDLRAIAIEMQASPVAAWRVELLCKGETEGYVLELGGNVTEAQAREAADKLRLATGVAPGSVRLIQDASVVEAAVEAAGTPFSDVR
jgi:hypothetical protein